MDEATADLLDQSEEPSHYKHRDDEARQDSTSTSHSIPLTCLWYSRGRRARCQDRNRYEVAEMAIS